MIRVLAIDGAATAGFACGATGEEPRFGTRCFTGTGASGEVVARFSRFLRATIEREQPDVIAYEAPYFPMGFRRGPPANAKTLRRLLGLAEIIDAIAWDHRLRCYQATAGEVTSYLTGKSNWGGRAAKKAATIAAARAWGWPVEDDNQADACAVWAFAESILDPVAASRRRARLGMELSLHPLNEDASQRGTARRRGIVQPPKRRGVAHGNRKSNTTTTSEFQFALPKMKRRPMPAGASEVDRPLFSESPAKVKRRPVDGRRFDGSYPSPSPAPDYGDLAGDRQPHDRLVAGRESGLAPGSFLRSRP